MATLKQIRRRIRSVRSTKQITKAMEMVAAAKLRKAQAQAEAARPYAQMMEQVLKNLSGAARSFAHPLFEERAMERVLLAVVASDKGLCGSFNANLLRRAEEEIERIGRERVELVPIGKRAWAHFRRTGWKTDHAIQHLGDKVDLSLVRDLGRHAIDRFLARDVDRVEFIYTRFISTTRREVERVPLVPVTAQADEETASDYIFEPDAEAIFGALLPRYVSTRVLSVLADSLAAEFSARRVAMSNATQNAEDMISSLALTANKLRQAAITKELLEIVGGAAVVV